MKGRQVGGGSGVHRHRTAAYYKQSAASAGHLGSAQQGTMPGALSAGCGGGIARL